LGEWGLSDQWREGARVNDPLDRCPSCNQPVIFASDFKKFGKQSVRVCVQCRKVYVNGKPEGDLSVGDLLVSDRLVSGLPQREA
jgi:hypothetical protein